MPTLPTLDERRIQEIVERVVARLGSAGGSPTPAPARPAAAAGPEPARHVRIPPARNGVYDSIDAAVEAARRGFVENERAPLELRRKMLEAMRETTRRHVRELSQYAVDETTFGRADDKVNKNLLVVEKTPGTEILRPQAFTGDDGLTLIERAPYGAILAVTPCTNPTETILCNAIGMVAGGNSVVFNVHPAAARLSAWHVHLLNEAIQAVGGPKDVVVCVATPTIESAQALMKHKGIRLVVVTGGPGVVQAAMNSGKKVIAAGPGNPPAVVDETANLDVAARGIVAGASIDNNIICTAEKEIIAVAAIADRLKELLGRNGALILHDRQVRDLEKVILEGDGTNKKWVGKNAGLIAKQIGISAGDDLRLLVAELDEAHPFVQHELLMPVLGLVRARDAAEAIAVAKRVEHGFGHTAVMYSTNIDNMSAMARVINTSIFVKNASNLAGLGLGGEGYTSFTIASPTGEGLTTAVNFTRERRCTLKDAFRVV
ncbi:MAG TPA: aldehyde dehydrogenase family protein [Haliangiales bacterium]|nr:aldehyde dehydrogenase family protein [Haliangiales bacterium]